MFFKIQMNQSSKDIKRISWPTSKIKRYHPMSLRSSFFDFPKMQNLLSGGYWIDRNSTLKGISIPLWMSLSVQSKGRGCSPTYCLCPTNLLRLWGKNQMGKGRMNRKLEEMHPAPAEAERSTKNVVGSRKINARFGISFFKRIWCQATVIRYWLTDCFFGMVSP